MKNNINYQKKLDERNPFEYAKATNDARFSHLLKRMHSLKLMVYLLMGIIGALIFCCFSLITKPQVIPYVVEVNPQGRVVDYGKMINATDYQVTPIMAEHYIKKFIKNIRTVDYDPVVIKRNWNEAHAFATKKCANILNRIYTEYKPLDLVKTHTVVVKFNSYLDLGEKAKEIQWTEYVYSLSGVLESNKSLKMMLTYAVSPNLSTVDNPSGFFIDAINLGEVK